MDKREIIERVLGAYLAGLRNQWDALAEQAIVIECEVEHTHDRVELYGTQFPMSIIKASGFVFETLQGHHGTSGKALAIILPLDKHNG